MAQILTKLVVLAYCLSWSHILAQDIVSTIIPLYIWPGYDSSGNHSWQALIDAKSSHPSVPVWAIVNVNNGPGTQISAEYQEALQKLKEKSINVMGYVYTSYGNRDAIQVKADIDKWQQFYSSETITGIFFDEMAYENTKKRRRGRRQQKNQVDYYTDLTNYAKSKGIQFTVGNPGTDTKEEFVNSVDTIIIFETDTGFPSESQYGGWHKNYPKNKWGILPYNVQTLEQQKVRDAKEFVGHIYVTDDKLPNPWDTLPHYLPQLFNYLDA